MKISSFDVVGILADC